ncbi:MAG: NAD(P)-dependent oxidoreductase [Deltaproteobacteria bacterium]
MANVEHPKRIGFVGLGKMGRPMAANLIAAGFQVIARDVDPAAQESFGRQHTCTMAASLAELAAESEVIVTMLPNGKIVRDSVLGANGDDRIVDSFPKGGVLIDMSSSAPQGTCQLGEILAGQGIEMLDAPVSGGVGKANEATLAIMVGGTDETIQRCEPILQAMGSKIFRTGGLGSGHAVKALNNMLSAVGLVGAVEAFLVGKRFGLDPEVMLEVINSSTGRNNSTENKFERYILSRAFNSGFALDLMLKDLTTAVDLAKDTQTPIMLSALCRELCASAHAVLEKGADHTDVARWFEDLCGTHLAKEDEE